MQLYWPQLGRDGTRDTQNKLLLDNYDLQQTLNPSVVILLTSVRPKMVGSIAPPRYTSNRVRSLSSRAQGSIKIARI
jgi:hypothetical protein